MLQVTYFQRKRWPSAHFSLEFIFQDVRERLVNEIDSTVRLAPYYSNGLFRRLAIALDARFHQGQVNHVTGDINFVAILLDPRRTILTNHDCGYLNTPSWWKRWLLKKLWLDWPVGRSRFVTTVSNEAKNQILKHTNCDPDRVVVIYNPISELYQHTPKEFSPTNVRILQVGTAQNKNILRLVEAIQGLDCSLVIIGAIGRAVTEQLQRCKVRYENLQDLSLEDVVRQYQLADMVAFASTYEGFGMPIVEANAVGRPVVTSNLSSMPEVAGDAACFVDPLDINSIRTGIEKVIRDRDYREELVRKGLLNVQRFRPNAIAQRYLQLYRQIAEECRTRTSSRASPSEDGSHGTR